MLLSKFKWKVSPVLAGLAVLAVPALSQAAQAQTTPPLTQLGDRGPAVKTAEASLQKLGYYRGALDSTFGTELLAAVKSFQGQYGLTPDGILGAATWGKLITVTPGGSTASASRTPRDVRLGNAGPGVLHLQKLLNKHGYHLSTDGHFGALTYSALRNFQASHGLTVDGIAGSATLNALEHGRITSAQASDPLQAPPPDYPPGYLHKGDKGAAVRTLQGDLTRLGYSTGGVDGDFGAMTLQAVEAFQAAKGLPAHGLVGSLTWNALHEALASTGTAPLSNRGSISPTAAAVVGIAMKYQGYPYLFGGNTPSGFDCSGLAQWVYAQVGISLPRTTFAQWDVGVRISYDELEPGDLVFFTTDGVFGNHVGIYLGNGEMIDAASPGQGVVVQSLNSAYYRQSYDGAVRVIN